MNQHSPFSSDGHDQGSSTSCPRDKRNRPFKALIKKRSDQYTLACSNGTSQHQGNYTSYHNSQQAPTLGINGHHATLVSQQCTKVIQNCHHAPPLVSQQSTKVVQNCHHAPLLAAGQSTKAIHGGHHGSPFVSQQSTKVIQNGHRNPPLVSGQSTKVIQNGHRDPPLVSQQCTKVIQNGHHVPPLVSQQSTKLIQNGPRDPPLVSQQSTKLIQNGPREPPLVSDQSTKLIQNGHRDPPVVSDQSTKLIQNGHRDPPVVSDQSTKVIQNGHRDPPLVSDQSTKVIQNGHNDIALVSDQSTEVIQNSHYDPPLDNVSQETTKVIQNSHHSPLISHQQPDISHPSTAFPILPPIANSNGQPGESNSASSRGSKEANSRKERDIDSNVSKKVIKSKLCSYIQRNEFGSDHIYRGPYGHNIVTYLDYTASGRPLRCIESYIQQYVLPTYANTHTEVSHNAIQTTIFREEARDAIRKSVNAGKDDCIIFTGSGVTAAINKLVHCLNLPEAGSNVVVFIGPYEHHSNILPWDHSGVQVIRIPQNKDGLIDVDVLASKLEEVCNNPKATASQPFVIGSFSAASNVTGIITPTDEICCLLHKYNGLVFWDYACAAPYVCIDMNPKKTGADSNDEPYKDAVFISPHKFVGGPGTPGILVAKRWLFQNPVPHDSGGGTVLFVRRKRHVFTSNPEQREEGGTPSIIESIRCGLVFKLKDALGPDFIMKREEVILKKALNFLQDVDGLVILGNTNVHRLPILSMLFYNGYSGRFVHHDFIATVFNDVFGMQVRSGCACAGPYGLDLMGMSEENAQKFEKLIIHHKEKSKNESTKMELFELNNAIYKPGFVRLNLPYFITDKCMDFTLAAVKMVAMHGWSLLPQYTFDADKGGWKHKGRQTASNVHLKDVSFASGSMTAQPLYPDCSVSISASDSIESVAKPEITYSSILQRGQCLFYDALSGLYDCESHGAEDASSKMAEELGWFMTPREAADIIHKRRKRPKLKPENLPFLPGALAVKLGINPRGHKGRSKEMDQDFIMEYFPKE